jgi:hypothetical protein
VILLLGLAIQVYASEEGRFEAWFPGKPILQRQKDERGPEWDTHKVRVNLPERSFLVSYYQAPETKDVDAFSANLKKAYAAAKWTVLKESKLTLGAYAGLALTLRAEDKTISENRFYFVGPRRYHLTVATLDGAAPDHPDIAKFLDSFKLLD